MNTKEPGNSETQETSAGYELVLLEQESMQKNRLREMLKASSLRQPLQILLKRKQL
ncbi:MAG: hypothetical protein IPG01_19415 [Chitinophagaceae bacterium]|nr:hypothetical protein [Chitinophagaceae bacterium]